MRTYPGPLLLLLLALPLSECGGGNFNSSSPTPAAPAAPLSVSATLPDSLTATLAEDRATVPVGGSITYTLTLTNDTRQSITFTPVSGGSLASVGGSLTITSPAGSGVYPPPSSGPTPASGQIGPSATLQPGQSVAGAIASGNVFPTSGSYAATASFTVQPGNGLPNTVTTVGPLTVTAQQGVAHERGAATTGRGASFHACLP